MNIEDLRNYCLSKRGANESFPFDETTLVFKVLTKIFAITGTDGQRDFAVNLKCDPELAIELREQYPAVQPGYHMNKKHWNTVYIDGSVSDEQLREWIDHSYELVAKSLTKKEKEALAKE